MRLRVAKKVHLGTQCRPGEASRRGGRRGCHKWSTIEEASARICKTVLRHGKPTARMQREDEASGLADLGPFCTGSRLLGKRCLYELFPNVSVDWDWTPAGIVVPPTYVDPHPRQS